MGKRKNSAAPAAAARSGTSRPAAQPARRALRLRLAGAAVIALATSAAYLPSLKGGFILDDNLLLTESRLIAAPDGLFRFWLTTEPLDYFPVSNTTLWVEWRLWGMNATGYRISNLLLHVASAILIWVILGKLSIAGAFLAALSFAVHPVNVESVAWIAQRKGLLALVFSLASALCYLGQLDSETRARRVPRGFGLGGDGWYWLSLVGFVLAMLSKGSAAVLPVLLLGMVRWLRPLSRRDVQRAVPFFLVSLVLVPVNGWFQTSRLNVPIRSVGFGERLLGAAGVVWFYLSKAVLPIHLTFVYPQWHVRPDRWQWWLPLLATVAVTSVLWWRRETWGRPLLFAWGFFCVALLPVMGFTDVGFMQQSLVADHYQHMALIAVAAVAGAGWGTWRRRARGRGRWVPDALAVAVVGALAVLTWQQSGLYADARILYRAGLERNPQSWMLHTDLGALLSRDGRPQEAIEHYRQALQVRPDYPEAHNNLGSELAKAGRVQEAIEHYQQALQINPELREARYNLALARAQNGEVAAAIEEYEQALRLNPYYPEVHYNLGIALADVDRVQEAIDEFQQALRLKSDYPEAHNNLGTVLARAGELQAALAHYEEALRLEPDYDDARRNLDVLRSMQRQGVPTVQPR
jgi:protein O-mannosyl-transferase